MLPATPLTTLQKAILALLMTWAAGFIDLVGYLSLYQIYPAHMSGNTVAMARHLALVDWFGVARRGWPVVAFVVGLMLGAFVFDYEKRRGPRGWFPMPIILEAILVGTFVMAGFGAGFATRIPPQPATKFYVMVALLTIAMGLQNTTIRKVGGINVYTTFVTGSLVKFAEAFSEFLFWVRDRTRWRFRRRIARVLRVARRQANAQNAALTLALWFSYLLGAVCGQLSTDRWALLGLLAPLGLLIALAVYGCYRPFLQLRDEEDH